MVQIKRLLNTIKAFYVCLDNKRLSNFLSNYTPTKEQFTNRRLKGLSVSFNVIRETNSNINTGYLIMRDKPYCRKRVYGPKKLHNKVVITFADDNYKLQVVESKGYFLFLYKNDVLVTEFLTAGFKPDLRFIKFIKKMKDRQ